MGGLEIKKYPDPILRKKAEEIGEITPGTRKLADDMIGAMRENDGCGLAAPQVGVSKRLIVLDVGEGPMALANPEITWQSREKTSSEEGCLSLPGVSVNVKRHYEIEVSGTRLSDGKTVKIRAFGLLAVALQHEIDHLDGVLIIDRAGLFQKFALRKKAGEKAAVRT